MNELTTIVGTVRKIASGLPELNSKTILEDLTKLAIYLTAGRCWINLKKKKEVILSVSNVERKDLQKEAHTLEVS